MREKRKDEGLPEHEQRRNESLTGKTRAKSEPIFQGQTTWEGQMGQTVNLRAYAFGGSNPSLPTKKECRLELQDLRRCPIDGRRGGKGRL